LPRQSFPTDLADSAAELLAEGRRLVIWGPAGTGKSTLAAALAVSLEVRGRRCWGIAADPGSPAFGLPGTLSLGCWGGGGWVIRRRVPLCSLDPLRFRLPAVLALRRIAAAVAEQGTMLIDAPGCVRGAAAAELLLGIVDAVGAQAVLAILPEGGAEAEAARSALAGLRVPVYIVRPSPLARRRTKRQRARERTVQWDRWLAAAEGHAIDLWGLRLEGVPPRLSRHWAGHQIAVLDEAGEVAALGEAEALSGGRLRARLLPVGPKSAEWVSLVVRDAVRGPDGLLSTVRGAVPDGQSARLPPELASLFDQGIRLPLFAHLGAASAALVNGLFGDPLLHIRLRHERRSILFDLGDSGRLPAKIAHQVSDCFITHAHMDHIGGFLWFLRSRLGQPGLCRLYGPPGLARHVAAFVAGIRWDRIGEEGPPFEIAELESSTLHRFRLRVGQGDCEHLGETSVAANGVLLDEPGFRVRAVTLDHGIPVLAFALDTAPTLHVRPERLAELGLPEGPWVGKLKRALAAGDDAAWIRLPDGQLRRAQVLGEELVRRDPPRRLAYATDLCDTPENRARLTAFAQRADVLFCEAAFCKEDAPQARRTGHLTARACGEIAAASQVRRLVPFHFSRRYEAEPGRVYAQVREAFAGELVEAEMEQDGD
jgi:ribonuclease BN (tRNA processing enzyme)/energy-coupling factor transporter ATP-binding protein EcfA2